MKIPGYSIEGQIGQGGMAVVYRAIQESLGRPVALKVMNPLLAVNPEFSERFLNEGRLLASLRHNHIMTIYDIGVSADLHYISMEYVDGGDLRHQICQGMSPETSLDYVLTLGSCLKVAHEAYIVHRDVKPVNILFRRDGTLLLTDFGIAKQLGDTKGLTVTGSMVGSPYYLSPEQALGRPIDGRADIYSLGIVLYEMLTGVKPFEGDSEVEVALKHIEGELPRLPPHLSSFQPLLEKMTAKNPDDRFSSAASMLQAALHLRDSMWGYGTVTAVAPMQRLAMHEVPGASTSVVGSKANAAARERTVILEEQRPSMCGPAEVAPKPDAPQEGRRFVSKAGLKRRVTLNDEALLQEEESQTSTDTPEPPPAASTSEKPGEETTPAALPEDVDVDEADSIPLFSAMQSLSGQASIPIHINADLYSLITPTYIQIASPRHIEPKLLRPFDTGGKEITLVFLANKKAIPATVHTIHHTYFLADTIYSTLSHRPGERLLVLFPTLPGKRYVLQAVIDEIYTGRFKLRYQDPRYDVRRQLRLTTPVLLRLVPPTIVTAIAQERIRIVRDIHIPAQDTLSIEKGSIADRLYLMDTAIVSPHMHLLEQVAALPCGMHDISSGGVCLTLPGTPRPEEMLHRVIRLHIPLPGLAANTSQGQYMPFELEPFGVIRNVKTTALPWTLHIRFLKRLPQECDLLFAHLEQRYMEQQTPLG